MKIKWYDEMEMNETLILRTNLTFFSVGNIKKAILKYLIYDRDLRFERVKLLEATSGA